MRYTRAAVAAVLVCAFGLAQACPGEKKSSEQSQSGTVSKPLAPKPSA